MWKGKQVVARQEHYFFSTLDIYKDIDLLALNHLYHIHQ